MPETPGREDRELIGRSAELARIDAFLNEARTGDGGLLTLVGPAGVGKSRLITEAMRRARLRGFRVLHGSASPHQEELSYAPLVEALRPLINDAQQLSSRSVLDGLVDLCRLFPDLPLGLPDPLVEAGVERTRLAEAVWRLLTRMARQRPLMVVLENLHCADGATIATLEYLARGLEKFPLLLVTACRPVPDSNDAAAQFLRAIPDSTRLEILPLDAPDIAGLIEQRLGGPASEELVALIQARTQGVPLFVVGLLEMLADSGRLTRIGDQWVPLPGADRGVPAGAAEFFASRLASFSAEDRRLIQAIAVCGDAATVDVLRQVSAVADANVRLADLRRKGVVTEVESAGEILYATTQPLLAEVAYGQLLESARRAMHAKAARLIQQRWPADVSRLAAHVSRAGSEVLPDHALAVLSTATSVALQKLAGAEAMRHAEAAVSIAERSGRSDVLPRLNEQLAEAAALSGLPERSMDAYVTAADRAIAPLEQARLLHKAANVAWQVGRFEAAYFSLDQAEKALEEIDAVAAIDVRILLAEHRYLLATREANQAKAESAIAELRVLADAHPQPAANRARVGLSSVPSAFSDADVLRTFAATYGNDAVDRVAGLGDALLLAHMHRPWVIAALIAGDISEARRRSAVARKHAQQVPRASYEVPPLILGGWTEFIGGEWNRALELADEAHAIAYRTAIPRDRAGVLALRAMILLRRGQVEEARRDIADARVIFGPRDRHISATLDTVETLLSIITRHIERAVELALDLTFLSSGHIPLITQQVRCEAFIAAGDLPRAREVVAFLEAGNSHRHIRAQIARLEGLIAVAEGDSGVAGEKLFEATEELTDLGLPFDAALAALELAEVTSDATPAERALTVFDRLEAKPFADRARQLLRRLGQPATAPTIRSDGELSGREREVAFLVAQGLSNAAIAERLFISPRTVTTHLDRIYRRLGVRSRAALTRYVLEEFPAT